MRLKKLLQHRAEHKILGVDKEIEKAKFLGPGGGGGGGVTSETDPIYSASEAASLVAGDAAKLAGIEAGAEVNNISDVNATDLTDGGETNLHSHAGGGVTDHSDLTELDYASAGHTGFEPTIGTTTDKYIGDITKVRNATITRTNGYITSVAKASGKTYTITRDGNNLISSITDGTKTWTYTRTSGYISSLAVT